MGPEEFLRVVDGIRPVSSSSAVPVSLCFRHRVDFSARTHVEVLCDLCHQNSWLKVGSVWKCWNCDDTEKN